MAVLSAEVGFYEVLDEIFGEGLSDDPRSKTKDVDIVVLNHLMGCIAIMGNGSPNAPQLVGCDARSCARSTNNDAPLGASIQNSLSNRGGVVWIVDRLAGMGAQVVYSMTRFGQPGGQMLFERVPGVVRADSDSHDGRQGSEER